MRKDLHISIDMVFEYFLGKLNDCRMELTYWLSQFLIRKVCTVFKVVE